MFRQNDIDRFARLSDDELYMDCAFDAGDREKQAIQRELKRRKAEREVNAELERLGQEGEE